MASKLKSWDQLSEARRKRLTAYGRKIGKTGEEVYADDDLRRAGSGHAGTPYHRETALRHPLDYQAYIKKNQDNLALYVETWPPAAAAYAEGANETEIRWDGETSVQLLFSKIVPRSSVPSSYTTRTPSPTLDEAENYASSIPFGFRKFTLISKTDSGFWTVYLPKDTDTDE